MASSAQKLGQIDAPWDVAVIGGGPAGMMAAARAAERGLKVVLIEKNKGLGKKLLITGGGRCNVLNAEFDTRALLARYNDAGKFLASPFSQWSSVQALEFFHGRGMPTKVEAEQRVFPLANTARAVYDVLVDYLRETGVEVRENSKVKELLVQNGEVQGVATSRGNLYAKSVILATGGTSHPETGSTGDGYPWLRALGHTVHEARAALVPIATKEAWVRRAAGVALKDAKITLYQNDVKQAQKRGKVLFTHVGLSGPGILNMSSEIGELLKYGEVIVEIDLLPDMGYEKVNTALQALLKEHHTKMLKNALSTLVSPALVPSILALAEIAPETPCNSVTKDARMRLMKTLKHLRLTAARLLGMDKAIVTSGGVDLREIDLKTMRSLKCANLYLIGDILDIDRPSGGYSLQLCWTTGFVAGSAVSA